MRVDDIRNGENMGEWSPYGNSNKKSIYTGKTLMGKPPASRRLAKMSENGSMIMGGNSLMNSDIEGSYLKPKKVRQYDIMDYSDVTKGPRDPSKAAYRMV